MMTQQRPTLKPSVMIAGIDRLIELIQEEAKAVDSQMQQGLPIVGRGAQAPTPRPLDDLDLFVARLRQLKDWLQQDPRLLPLVDDYIGVQVRAMEKRQTWQNINLAVATTLIGVLLGWASSLLGTPASVLHFLFR